MNAFKINFKQVSSSLDVKQDEHITQLDSRYAKIVPWYNILSIVKYAQIADRLTIKKNIFLIMPLWLPLLVYIAIF